MNTAEKEFLNDLKAICKQHGVALRAAEQYNGNETFAGTNYSFQSADHSGKIDIRISDAQDIINQQ